MIDPRTKEFGMMLVESPYWHWLPGMLMIAENGNTSRVIRIRKSDGWVYLASNDWGNTVDWYNPIGSYPDIFDPATLGCIISLLKFRMKQPTLHFTPDEGGWYLNKLSLDGPEWYCGNGTWGLDDCYSPLFFSSQQEAVAIIFSSLHLQDPFSE